MMQTLADKSCVPCKGGTPPLKAPETKSLVKQVGKGWRVVENHHLEREYKFHNFKEALDFTNQVGELAETVGHHPDVFLSWGLVRLTVWTHKIDGLTESDFIFAAKVNRLR